MIALAGKERSGTTWLEHLLRRNYVNGGIDARQKHGFTAYLRERDMQTIVISKHPLEWWYSYYRYLKRSNEELQFRDMDYSLFEAWNAFYLKWIEWSYIGSVDFVRYSNLVLEPEAVLDKLGLRKQDKDFDRINNRVESDGTVSELNFLRRTEAMRYEYSISEGVKEMLSQMVSPGVMAGLGYTNMNLEENSYGNSKVVG